MPNAIALQSIQFNVARVIGPALGGIALTQLGEMWCFGLNGVSFFAPIISLLMLKTRFYPAEDNGIDSGRHEAGHRLHSQPERHGGAHGAGVLHDRCSACP